MPMRPLTLLIMSTLPFSVVACDATSSTTSGDGDPQPDAASSPDAPTPDQLGTVTTVSATCQRGPGRLPNTTCRTLRVSCPRIDPIDVEVRVTEPAIARGTVIFGSGGSGKGFSYDEAPLMDALVTRGFRLVQRGWLGDGWLANAEGTGLAASACRYATLAHWVRDEYASGPLCITGNSGGAAEIGMALTRWNLDSIVTQALPSSGPGTARMDQSCAADPAWRSECATLSAPSATTPACTYADNGLDGLIDQAWTPETPCTTGGVARHMQLLEDSALAPAADLSLGAMRLDVLLGAGDPMATFVQGRLFAAGVTAGELHEVILADTGHAVPESVNGAAALVDRLTDGCR